MSDLLERGPILPESRRSTAREQDPERIIDEGQKKSRSETSTFRTDENIVIYFDGAKRGNGKVNFNGEASCGVFVKTYDNPFTQGMRLIVETNQQSELSGGILALETALQISKALPPEFNGSMEICGDSTHVIGGIVSGRASHHDTTTKNGKLWMRLNELIAEIAEMSVPVSYRWVPRTSNKEANEICESVCDKRPICHDIVSLCNSDAEVDLGKLVDQALTHITTFRRRTLRHLPAELGKHWSRFLIWIALEPTLSATIRRKLFLIAPHLLSAHQSNVKGREDFKFLRAHLTLLCSKSYLIDTIKAVLMPQKSSATPKADSTISNSTITSLAAQGLLHKLILLDTDTEILPAESIKDFPAIITPLFPQTPLPTPLPTRPTAEVRLTFAQLAQAHKRMGRGKAPGLSGWTRELFHSIFGVSFPPTAAKEISNFFSSIAAAEITDCEKRLIKSAPLILLRSKSKNKIRPLTMKDCLTKMVWCSLLKIALLKDPRIYKGGSSFGKKGAVAAILITLQKCLDDDRWLMCMDATNAYNCVNRAKGFDYILAAGSAYDCLFAFINMNYAELSWAILFYEDGTVAWIQQISAGTGQGCTSAAWFFHICTFDALPKEEVLNVADDIYIIESTKRDGDQQQFFISGVLFDLQTAHLDMLGPKAHMLGSSEALERFETQVGNRWNGKRLPAYCKPSIALGSVLVPKHANGSTNRKALTLECLKPKLTILHDRVNKVLGLPTTKMIQFQALRSIQWYSIYLISTLQGDIADHVASYIDEIFTSAALSIMGMTHLKSADLQFLIHTPLEDGGCGLLPYSDIHQKLHDMTLINALDFLKRVHVKHESALTAYPSIKWLWKHIYSTRRSTSEKSDVVAQSWIDTRPNLAIRQMDDEHFVLAMHVRAKVLPPIEYVCGSQEPPFDFANSSPSERFDHFFTCPQCSAAQNHKRHNLVVAEIHKTLKYHGIVCEANPSDLPLQGKTKGGPDFMIYEGQHVLVGDVAITKNDTNTRFNQKAKWYETFSSIMHATTLPYIMSLNGNTSSLTAKKMLNVLHKSVVADIIANVQFANINGIFTGFHRLSLRQHLSIQEEHLSPDLNEAPVEVSHFSVCVPPPPASPLM